MPRPQLIRSDFHPYHITSRTNNKEFFPLPIFEVWKIMKSQLAIAHEGHGLAVHGFVLMGNHFHLLCHTPKGNLDQIMQSFLRGTSLRINTKAEGINHLWGSRYKWSLITSQNHYFQVYRYIFQNPVRAGLCKKVQEYPYSTLNESFIPLHSFIPMSFGGNEGELLWLNQNYGQEEVRLIKLGLRKYQFDVSQRKISAFSKLTAPNSHNVN